MSGRLQRGDLLRVFARLLFIQATLHRRGMQNLGVLHALDAAAPRLSPNGNGLLARHTEYFNTNPNTAPLVVGGVLRIEDDGEAGARASVSRFKQAAGSALAAMGDMLFVGALKPLALTLACLSAIYSFFPGLLAVLLLYNAVVIASRYWGVSFGYSRGWGVVDTFSGHGVQRLLGIARGAAAFAGGVLVAILIARVRGEGVSVVAAGGGVAVVVFLASRRIPAPWVAAALFPLSWAVALILK
ncbi:MAG TPA: PTS system mannose/fructose/sorbose family transporter subunit IID [Candidatus Krumholzibacteria bacterium]|nr:PTS system mannose/fructose/sorbose family transporter subunit IID [Candidatus Krumholzibacteria bacterium]